MTDSEACVSSNVETAYQQEKQQASTSEINVKLPYMAENELSIRNTSEEGPFQKTSKVNNVNQISADMWREFADNTTLHGIRYVFMKRHILIRLLWLAVLLTSGGYYSFTVYKAFDKYYSRPISTVLSRKHFKEMDFPAVTICSLNLFAKSKLLVTDDNPLFASSGLNISSCAVTSEVRGNWPCGLSLLCCCTPSDLISVRSTLPYCNKQYEQDLLTVMKQYSHRPDIEGFYRYYSQDISALLGPICTFGWEESDCFSSDFVPLVTPWGMCYTFNSGIDGQVKTVNTAGVSTGLSVILDAQTSEYTQGKYSEGFKVLIHGQGEYVDEWDGINIGPGQHAVIALSQKRVKFSNDVFETFPECFLPGTDSKNTLKKIDQKKCVGPMLHICACNGTYHAHYFIGPRYILQ